MPAKIYHAPDALPPENGRPGVFLAGSIDNGAAEDWQSRMVRELSGMDIAVFNPRRKRWDSSWDCDAGNAEFREQVEWELSAQERADLIAFHFVPGTKAPITLLELGLAARDGKALVCCPEGFWRRGNVDIVCEQHGLERVSSFQGLVDATRSKMDALADVTRLALGDV